MRKIKTKDGYLLDWGSGEKNSVWEVQVFKKLKGYKVPQFIKSYVKKST